MIGKRRWTWIGLGVLVLAFGLGCLNYTEAEGLERHRTQAERLGIPPPTKSIFLMGVGATVLGAGLAGFGLARSQPA